MDNHFEKVIILTGIIVTSWLYHQRPRAPGAGQASAPGKEAPFYQTYNTWPVPQASIFTALPANAIGYENAQPSAAQTDLLTQVIL